MFDLQTYIIYITLLGTLMWLLQSATRVKGTVYQSELVYENTRLNALHYLALFSLILVVGYRYEVGTDWWAYVIHFEQLDFRVFESANEESFEIGFFYLTYFLNQIGLAYPSMFAAIALMTWLFIFKSFDRRIVPWVILFIFLDEYFFWSMNVIRQFLAMSIFIYSIRYIVSKKIWHYLFLIALASLFHLTALILIPLYWLPYKKLFNERIWLAIYVITLFLSNTAIINNLIIELLYGVAEIVPPLSIYLNYFGSEKLMAAKMSIGLGYLFKVLISLMIIYFSPKVVKKYPETKVFFVLFFFGAVIFNLFYMIHLIDRLNHYLLIMRSISLALVVYFLWSDSQKRPYIIGFNLVFFLLFCVAIYNSSNMSNPFRFYLP